VDLRIADCGLILQAQTHRLELNQEGKKANRQTLEKVCLMTKTLRMETGNTQ
jgi:hypothetical protein